MATVQSDREFNFSLKLYRLLLNLAGISVLLLKRYYGGPLDAIVHAYAGNFFVSFAVYFLFANVELPRVNRRLLAVAVSFAVVQLFEAFDGFGVMSNTYDPVDFLANAGGIALALWVDAKLMTRPAPDVQ